MSDIKMIMLDNSFLNNQNANWRSYFQDLADFCQPRKAWKTSVKTVGERLKFNFLYDTEAIQDRQTMVSGIHSHLTDPTSRWFSLQSRDIDLMDNFAIRKWFYRTEQKILSTIAATNFDTAMQEFYDDYVTFGTGCLFIQEDDERKVRFTAIPIETVNLVEDSNGKVIGVYRNFKLTAMQAYGLWGEAAGKSVMDAYNGDEPFKELDFLHYVGLRKNRDRTKEDSLNMKFESVWINLEDSYQIKESGYHELPYVVARFWKDNRECFGFSPAMLALADVHLINAQKKTALRRGMKETDPPFSIPSRGYMLPLNFNPSAANYRDPKMSADTYQAIGVGAGQFSITVEMMNMTIASIQKAFAVNLFQALSAVNKQMTVPEVQQRINEGMRLLGPVVGRCTDEALNPLIFRVMMILYRNGEIDEIPEELQGKEMDIEYLGVLAKAQKQSELTNLNIFLTAVNGIEQVIPGVKDNIDGDKTVNLIHKMLSISPEILRDPRARDEMRKQQAQIAMEQYKMKMMYQGAATAKTGAEAMHKGKMAEAIQ